DFRGVGVNDVICSFPSVEPTKYFKHISNVYPYFDTIGTGSFIVSGRTPLISIWGSVDCNEDGFADLVGYGYGEHGFDGYIIFHGSSHIDDSGYKYPDDSLHVGNVAPKGGVVGTFSRNGKPMIFLRFELTDSSNVTTYKIGVLRHLDDLAHDSVVYLSETIHT